MGCEDLNTFCPKDNNDSNNSTDSNITCPDCNSTIPVEHSVGSNTIASSGSSYYPSSEISGSCSDSSTCSDSCSNPIPDSDSDQSSNYHLHTDIRTNLFWIGDTHNNLSAWDNDWVLHYGGVDTADQRFEYFPQAFTPDENPFYVALPYNDLDNQGELKPNIQSYIPWATDNDDSRLSICKNRWIKITANQKNAYAQWEDVGPSGDNDINYVFGGSAPLGIDISTLSISPAIRDYLGLEENGTVSWQFVEYQQVPQGPWKDIITTSISN